MLDLARSVVAKTSGIGRDVFDRDENLRLALAHLLQTIGEAARKVSRDYQASHPEVPWSGIVGMRHKALIVLWGYEQVIARSRAGLWMSFAVGASGVLTAAIHGALLARGGAEFRTTTSVALIGATAFAGLALLGKAAATFAARGAAQPG